MSATLLAVLVAIACVGISRSQTNDEDRARIDAFAPPLAATLRYYDAAMATDFKPNFGRW